MIDSKGVLFIFAIFSLKYGSCLADTIILQPRNFTSEWQLQVQNPLFPPLVTESKDNLIYVTFLSNKVRLEDSDIESWPCDIYSSLLNDHNHTRISPTQAVALGNGKVVISLLDYNSVGIESRRNPLDVWLYVVDLTHCSHQNVKFTVKAPINAAHTVIKLVPYQESFDVFLKSNELCGAGTICNLRFDDRMHPNRSIKLSLGGEEDNLWDIVTRKHFDQSEGYLYKVTKGDHQTTVKWLNAQMEEERNVSVISDANNLVYLRRDNRVGLFVSKSEHELECILLNELQVLKSLVVLKYDLYIQKYLVFVLGNDDAIIVTVLSEHSDGSKPTTYFQHVKNDGSATVPVKFQDYVCKNVNGLKISELAERVYCVSVICKDFVNTKCFRPS